MNTITEEELMGMKLHDRKDLEIRIEGESTISQLEVTRVLTGWIYKEFGSEEGSKIFVPLPVAVARPLASFPSFQVKKKLTPVEEKEFLRGMKNVNSQPMAVSGASANWVAFLGGGMDASIMSSVLSQEVLGVEAFFRKEKILVGSFVYDWMVEGAVRVEMIEYPFVLLNLFDKKMGERKAEFYLCYYGDVQSRLTHFSDGITDYSIDNVIRYIGECKYNAIINFFYSRITGVNIADLKALDLDVCRKHAIGVLNKKKSNNA